MKGRTIRLVGKGLKPQRFVAIVVVGLDEHCTFETDDAPSGKKAAREYLAAISKQESDEQQVKMLLTKALIAMAARDDPNEANCYLNSIALTEALGSPYVAIRVGGRDKPVIIQTIKANNLRAAKKLIEISAQVRD